MRYHHIFDPKTGRPATSGVLGVTVVAQGDHAGTLTDILTTTLFVMGEEKGKAFLENNGIDANALFITQQGDTFRFTPVQSGNAPAMRDVLTDVAQSVAWADE